MPQKLITFAGLLLAVIAGAGAQTPAAPANAAGPAAAWTSRAAVGAVAVPAPTDPAAEPLPTAASHHGHHIFGLPMKWVVVGAAAVATVVAIAIVAHNRTRWGPCHYAQPRPCP